MTFPTIRPALTLDFQKSRKLDPRITFSRSSSATYLDPATGLIKTAPDGVARLEKEGLLIEESRTNYVTDNDQALGIQSNITVSQVPGPDGVSTSATRMTSVAAGNAVARNATNRTIVWGSQDITTWSYFFKPVNLPDSVVYLGVVAGGGQGTVSVDYIDGTVVLNGSATDAGVYEAGNGWYRVWATYSDVLSNTTGMRLNAQFVATAAGQYMDVYGLQMEVGRFITSHIPTAGSTVTRAADVASISNAEMLKVVNPSGNACLMTTHWSTTGANQERMFNDGAGQMRIGQWRSNQIRSFRDGGNFTVAYTPIPGQENYNTVFESRDGNDIYIGNNAGAYGPNTSTQTLPATGNFLFGYQSNGQRKQTIARMFYYPQPLTQAELEATSEAMTA